MLIFTVKHRTAPAGDVIGEVGAERWDAQVLDH